jgi:hypothetical protein
VLLDITLEVVAEADIMAVLALVALGVAARLVTVVQVYLELPTLVAVAVVD